MGRQRWRPGIRPQLTIIVLLAAVLSTVATLIVTQSAVRSYVEGQARDQERENMKIAELVLSTNFGQNISISSDGRMVVDSPGSSGGFPGSSTNAPYGKYAINGDADYVDRVQNLINGMVSVYQCTDNEGNALTGSNGAPVCKRISTTFKQSDAANQSMATREVDTLDSTAVHYPLESLAAANMGLVPDASGKKWSTTAHEWPNSSAQIPIVTIDGTTYIADYAPITNPQNQVIGVLFVGVPYDAVTGVVANTTIELVIIGTIIMVAGVVLALFVASAIVGTLQRAARQVSTASERFGTIASQQASGSTQQVWAINAINQALQSLSETASDVSKRTEQLAQMGNQVLQHRAEIAPTQIDSYIAYLTRSARDISAASHQQAATYERMTGAMQAVMEVAEQVAGDSQQTTENAERLEQVVQQLRQLVGVSRRALLTAQAAGGAGSAATSRAGQGTGASTGTSMNGRMGTVQAVRPARGRKRGQSTTQEAALAGARPSTSGRGSRLGARPLTDVRAGAGAGRAGAANAPGMVVAGGTGQSAMVQSPAAWGAPYGAAPSGMGSSGAYGGMDPFASSVSGPIGGSAGASRWNVPGPQSGPGPAPWAMPSGPGGAGAAAPWSGQAPNSGPMGGRNPFDPNGNGISGSVARAPRRAGELPRLDGLPDLQQPGADSGFPWGRRE